MTESEAKTRVSKNGYHYTRQGPGNWVLTHHLVAAEKLGRPVNTDVETVRFVDGDRENLSPDNILVVLKNKKVQGIVLTRLKIREAALIAELMATQARIRDLEIDNQLKSDS